MFQDSRHAAQGACSIQPIPASAPARQSRNPVPGQSLPAPLTLGDARSLRSPHRAAPWSCRLRGLHLPRPSPLVFALHDSASTRTATVHSGGGGRFTAAKTTEGRQQTTEESCNVVPQDLCSALIYVFLLFDISMVW